MEKFLNQKVISFSKEYFLLFFFILLVANPFLMQNIESGVLIILLFTVFLRRSVISVKSSDLRPFYIVCYFIFFEFIHRIIFDLDNAKTIIRVSFYFISAIIVVKITRKVFLIYYINILYLLSLFSIIFYILGFMSPLLYSGLSQFATHLFPLRSDYNNYFTPTLLLYTFDPAYVAGSGSLLRNPGYTWEAGGFATYANIAILFRLIVVNPESVLKFFKDRIAFIIIIALLLTFSTAGYLTFFFILTVFFFKKLTFNNIIYMGIFILTVFMLFSRVEFLGDKIAEQISKADYSQNRFGSALLDWKDIQKRPIFGWSRDLEVIFKTKAYTEYTHRPNGLTNFIRSYGFPYVISYFLIMFFSVKRFFSAMNANNCKRNAVILVSIIIIMGFSQQVVHTMLTMSFLFLGYYCYEGNNQ